MPCNDGGVPYPPTRKEVLDSMAPAMLCAIFSEMTKIERENIILRINEKEAGVTQAEIEEWYSLHRQADRERRVREKAAADQAVLRKKAASKLTSKERKALGIKE